MNTKPNSVGIKLQELDQQYEQLKKDILICQTEDRYEIRKQIIEHRNDVDKDYLLLQDRIENSRSPILSQLAQAQMDLLHAFEDILNENNIAHEEATSLQAEHAIDLAIQTMRKAQLTILYAADYSLTNQK